MPTVEEAEIIEYVDDLLVHLALKERLLIRSLLALLEVQSLAFSGLSPSLFSRASPEAQTKNLFEWEHSRFFQRRLVFMAIRTLLLWAYADCQEVERDMGFVPGTQAIARRNARLAQARAEQFDAPASSPPSSSTPPSSAPPSATPSSSRAPAASPGQKLETPSSPPAAPAYLSAE